jgi:uncharacterized protein YecE (DUF72 family)
VGDNETRYRYLYSAAEIEELVHKVEEAGKQTKLTFAFFNNHWQGYAPRNAIDLIKALKLLVIEPPFQMNLPDEDSSEGRLYYSTGNV